MGEEKWAYLITINKERNHYFKDIGQYFSKYFLSSLIRAQPFLSLLNVPRGFNARFRIEHGRPHSIRRTVSRGDEVQYFPGSLCRPRTHGGGKRVLSATSGLRRTAAQCRRWIAVSRSTSERFPSISRRIVTDHPHSLFSPDHRELFGPFCFRILFLLLP